MRRINLQLLEGLLLTGFVLIASSSIGQDSSAQLATLEVLVTDFENNSRGGEQLLFEGKNSGLVYKGVSDKDGKFKIRLPGGEIYNIKIKGIGKDKDYNTLNIPALKEGETYTPSRLTIKYEPSKTFTLDNVHFESGKPTITKSSYAELEELLEYLTLKETAAVEIAGHTDNEGEKEYNLRLSQARADAVRKYLISNGIAPERLVAKGYGKIILLIPTAHPKGGKTTGERK